MRRADPTQKRAVGTGVLYNHLIINDLQGVAAPTPSGRYSNTQLRRRLRMESVTAPTLTITNNISLQSPDGGAAMGGIAAHGYVNGKAGTARQG